MEITAPIPVEAAIAVVIASVAMGAVLLWSPAYRYRISGLVGRGGVLLAGIGMVLILGPVFHEITFEALGIKVELSRQLRQAVQEDPQVAAELVATIMETDPAFGEIVLATTAARAPDLFSIDPDRFNFALRQSHDPRLQRLLQELGLESHRQPG